MSALHAVEDEADQPMLELLPMVTKDQRAHLMFVLSVHANRTGDIRSLDLLRLIHDDAQGQQRAVDELMRML